jgi:uridine kinase
LENQRPSSCTLLDVSRAECLERLASAIAAVRLEHPTRVAIDGVDGAGKTRLADELAGPLAAASARQIIRASVDGFHQPRAARYRRGADSAAGYYLDSFDYRSLRAELLEPLGPQGTRRFRAAVFDHRSDRPVAAPDETAASDAILLMDGVFLQRPELTDAWDYRVWVDAPFDVTVARAVHRDAAGGEGAAVKARYAERYVPGQRLYLQQCHPSDSADAVVNNADIANPELRFRSRSRLDS